MTVTAEPGLLGRDPERARLRELLGDARAGRSHSVLVRGDPGIGKTALLDDLAAAATDLRVVRTTGVEFESDLPFAGLAALCRPIDGYLSELAAIQAEPFVAATVTGHHARPDDRADRFAVYAATLALLAAAAEDHPLVCLIDDAHWLDRASVEALLFAARRFVAERILIVFAARTLPRLV